jgi:hypothetical protein
MTPMAAPCATRSLTRAWELGMVVFWLEGRSFGVRRASQGCGVWDKGGCVSANKRAGERLCPGVCDVCRASEVGRGQNEGRVGGRGLRVQSPLQQDIYRSKNTPPSLSGGQMITSWRPPSPRAIRQARCAPKGRRACAPHPRSSAFVRALETCPGDAAAVRRCVFCSQQGSRSHHQMTTLIDQSKRTGHANLARRQCARRRGGSDAQPHACVCVRGVWWCFGLPCFAWPRRGLFLLPERPPPPPAFARQHSLAIGQAFHTTQSPAHTHTTKSPFLFLVLNAAAHAGCRRTGAICICMCAVCLAVGSPCWFATHPCQFEWVGGGVSDVRGGRLDRSIDRRSRQAGPHQIDSFII